VGNGNNTGNLVGRGILRYQGNAVDTQVYKSRQTDKVYQNIHKLPDFRGKHFNDYLNGYMGAVSEYDTAPPENDPQKKPELNFFPPQNGAICKIAEYHSGKGKDYQNNKG
jgi:hypothetical protein